MSRLVKLSEFGFDEGFSDPYAANDADAISPYGQLSNPKDQRRVMANIRPPPGLELSEHAGNL